MNVTTWMWSCDCCCTKDLDNQFRLSPGTICSLSLHVTLNHSDLTGKHWFTCHFSFPLQDISTSQVESRGKQTLRLPISRGLKTPRSSVLYISMIHSFLTILIKLFISLSRFSFPSPDLPCTLSSNPLSPLSHYWPFFSFIINPNKSIQHITSIWDFSVHMVSEMITLYWLTSKRTDSSLGEVFCLCHSFFLAEVDFII